MATLLQGTTIGGHSAIHAGNIGSQSVNYASSAGSASANGGTADYAHQLKWYGAGASATNANTFQKGIISNYYGGGAITGVPESGYGSLYNFGGYDASSLSLQLYTTINHDSTSSTRGLYYRMGNNLGFQNDWRRILDATDYPQAASMNQYLRTTDNVSFARVDSAQFRFTDSSNNAYFTGGSDWGAKIQTDSGYIHFGPANGSYAHIYTDRGQFYFNRDILINNVQVVVNSGTWGINVTGSSNTATYALNSTRLYASDAPYRYGDGSPYYMYMNYDGGSYWELKVSPATPGAVRVAYSNLAGSANAVAWTNVSGRPTALSQFTNDLVISTTDNTKLPLAGGTMSGRLTLKSISGVEQTVPNDFGAYLHLGDWGVGRTATGAVLVNTAYRADYATDLFDMNISRFTNNSGYITGYTETDTLQSVTNRGASTSAQTSFTKTDDHAISVGTIRGRAVGSQTGEFIQLYERVNIGGPSGWGAANTAAPTYGLSVYGGANIGYGNSASLFAYAYRGNSNVAGTGEASYHPAGIYSTGTNWLYGTMYVNNNHINDVGYLGVGQSVNTNYRIITSGDYYANAGGNFWAEGRFKQYRGSGTWHDVIDSGNIGSQSVAYASSAGSAPNASNLNASYGVTAGAGNGLKFWGGEDTYKISMGNSAEYHYGPVTDYSIKTVIDSVNATRGFTWGVNGGTPIAALNVGNGNMQIAGTFNSSNFSGSSSGTNTGDQTNISGNASTANGANGNFYIDDNYGNTVVGVYTSTRYQGVFAMGDAYKLPADGTTTGSLYGLAWSHPNAGGVAGNLNTHGLLVMENGTFLAAISGSIRARDDVRAPIFYDSNDAGYYGNFASTSRMNAIVYDNLYFSGDQTYGFIGRNVYADTINGRGADPLELNYYDGGSVIIGSGANGSKALYAGSLYDSGSRVAISRGEGRQYVEYSRYVYNNGAYSGSGWVEPSDLGVRYAASANYATSAGSASSVAWSNVSSKPASWLNTGALVEDMAPSATAFPSGFYQSYTGSGNPTGTWFNYINVRHSNTGNGHGFQLGMSYYDTNLWFRSYQGGLSPSFSSWGKALSSLNHTEYMDAPNKAGTSYYQVQTWLQCNGTHGLYWPAYYDAHFSANDLSSYTQFAFRGSKNSYGGFYDNYSRVNGAMYDSGGNGGVYREANGLWYWYYHVGNNSMGIGSSANSSSYVVYASGSIYATGDIVAYSDKRKKTDIVTIDSALDKVMAMRGVFYTKIDESEKGRQVGVIAQEVNEILPEAVTYAADVDEYGVKYGNIVGVLIEAIKEQQKEIDELKAKLN